MRSILNRKLVIAVCAVVLLGGAAAAVAATQSSGGLSEQAYINDLAGRLNVTPSALEAAIKAADSDRIAAALAAGRITAPEAGALRQRIAESTGAPYFPRGLRQRGPGAFGFRAIGPGARGVRAAALAYLGISAATLRSDLAAGESLAAIANATANRSSAGLASAIIAAATAAIKDAFSSGRISGTQESAALARLPSRVSTLLQRSGTDALRPGGGGWRGRWRSGAAGSTGLFGSQYPA